MSYDLIPNSNAKRFDTKEAETFLQRMGVPFVKLEDGRLDVRGNLDISRKGLRRLPDLSNVIVRWNFSCANNPLESLMGAPSYVGKNCDVSHCGLKTLEGTLHTVGERFDCSNNQLPDLIGGPRSVGKGYDCTYNLLTTLAGLPTGFAEYLSSDFGTYIRGQIPANLLKPATGGRSIAAPPAAPVVPDLPSRQTYLSETMTRAAAPPAASAGQTVTVMQASKPSHVNKVMFVEDFMDKKMFTVFDFDRLERISVIRKDEKSPIEAMDRDAFFLLGNDPLLKKAFAIYRERGGVKSEAEIFPEAPRAVRRGVIKNDGAVI